MLSIDQLNKLNSMQNEIDSFSAEGKTEKEILDAVEDLLILAYIYGNHSVDDMLGDRNDISSGDIGNALKKKYGDRNYEEILKEHIQNGDTAGIKRVIDTETHRMYNEGVLNGGAGIAKYKKWETMQDEAVRETHEYLQGVSIPYGADFYTYDGDSGRYPGDFSKPQNNVNCRCWLVLS